jgi:catechol 2,3-dioxygenase-like lactoylglutathione lyase family enzyme
MIERVIPVLAVRSIKRSLEFYRKILGFELEWGGGEGETVGSIARDGQSIMLSEEANTGPSLVWIGLKDDSLFEFCKREKVKVVLEPRNMPWAYEMKIEDPDGNVLWLGTEPRT